MDEAAVDHVCEKKKGCKRWWFRHNKFIYCHKSTYQIQQEPTWRLSTRGQTWWSGGIRPGTSTAATFDVIPRRSCPSIWWGEKSNTTTRQNRRSTLKAKSTFKKKIEDFVCWQKLHILLARWRIVSSALTGRKLENLPFFGSFILIVYIIEGWHAGQLYCLLLFCVTANCRDANIFIYIKTFGVIRKTKFTSLVWCRYWGEPSPNFT